MRASLAHTYILPLLPNWRVPGFIRACTAVCFLERDFPVAIHGPMLPREILACGTCLVLSGEIAEKQRYRRDLRDSENVLLIDDPKDRPALAAVLRGVVCRPGARSAWSAQAGLGISAWPSNRTPAMARAGKNLLTGASPGARDVPLDLAGIVPELRSFLARWVPGTVRRICGRRR